MKKIIPLSLLSLSFMLFGCQSNEIDEIANDNNSKVNLSPEEFLSIRYNSSPELSQAEIIDLVSAFQANELKDQAHSRSFQPISIQIKNKYYLNKNTTSKSDSKARSIENTEEQIPIYEIDLTSEEGKGMAIVSGDRRAPHVLAYLDKVKDNETPLSASPNALLQWGEMYIRNEVIKFDEIKDSLYETATSKISQEFNMSPNDINYDNIKDKIAVKGSASRSTSVTEVPSNLKVKTAVFPMCPVTWGQWEPYNCKLPIAECERFGPGWTENTNYPTGCAPIIIAHLMASLETPLIIKDGRIRLRIDWPHLTENKEIKAPDYFNPGDPLEKREMVGSLFSYLYSQTSSYPVTNSKGVVTGSSCLISDIESVFSLFFNYNEKVSWDINKVKNSLKAVRPVFVYGKPDNRPANGVTPFILDGIKECYGRIDNVPKDIDICYLHANFGFGNGYQDGYYLMDIQKTTITFETTIPLIFKDSAMTIISDIRNKN